MAFLFFVVLVMGSAHAQVADTLFAEKLQRFCLSRTSVQTLFNLSKGESTTILLSPGLSLQITLNMHEKNAQQVETIGGTIAGYPDAFIALTLYNDHGTTKFEGELSSKRHNSAYRIFLDQNGMICFETIARSAILVED